MGIGVRGGGGLFTTSKGIKNWGILQGWEKQLIARYKH